MKLQETPAEALSGSVVALALRSLQAAEAPAEELARVLQEVVRELEQLPEEAKPEWRRALLFLFLLIQHKRPAEEQESLVEAVEEALEPKHRVEAEEVLMTGAQALEAKGRREGQRQLLIELLEYKFGPLSEAIRSKVDRLTEPQIKEISRKIISAASLSELGL